MTNNEQSITGAEIIFGPLIPAAFLRRLNRFRVEIEFEGQVTSAHLPNSGRLGELLVPGQKVWLAPADLGRNPQRRTLYDMALAEYKSNLVSVDARLPGHLIAKALENGRLPEFECYTSVKREVRLGESRLDFRLAADDEQKPCWIEVKSVTLVEGGTARFPDAPTSRGQRHVRELVRAVQQGDRAAVVFVVQRDDARQFEPHDNADPTFGRVLRDAAHAGVEVYAWRCQVSLKGVRLAGNIPVLV
jgi:sugar fermentation stimulation protein A